MNTEKSTDAAEPVYTMGKTALAFLTINVPQKNLKQNLTKADSAEFTKQKEFEE